MREILNYIGVCFIAIIIAMLSGLLCKFLNLDLYTRGFVMASVYYLSIMTVCGFDPFKK